VIRELPLPVSGPGIPTPLMRRHELTLAEVEEVIGNMPGVWGASPSSFCAPDVLRSGLAAARARSAA